MITDTTKYLSTTEFANRYNAMMPIDKDHMPLEPSFVELLCEKGEIDHSIIPARDGRKRDTIMIPEHELDKLDILINSDKAEKVEPKADPIIEKPLLTTKEVAELLGCHVTNIALMVKNGKLKPARNDMRGSRNSYKFDEDYILKYMEEHPKRERAKKTVAKSEPVRDSENENFKNENLKNENLKKVINHLNKIITDRDNTIRDLLAKAESKQSPAPDPIAKDIFEAYRKGFKDGYEMRGKQ